MCYNCNLKKLETADAFAPPEERRTVKGIDLGDHTESGGCEAPVRCGYGASLRRIAPVFGGAGVPHRRAFGVKFRGGGADRGHPSGVRHRQ